MFTRLKRRRNKCSCPFYRGFEFKSQTKTLGMRIEEKDTDLKNKQTFTGY